MTVAPVYKSPTPRTDFIWAKNSDTEGNPINIMKIQIIKKPLLMNF